MEEEADFLFIAYNKKTAERRNPVGGGYIIQNTAEIFRACIKGVKSPNENSIKRMQVDFKPKPRSIVHIVILSHTQEDRGSNITKGYTFAGIFDLAQRACDLMAEIKANNGKKILEKGQTLDDVGVVTAMVQD